MANSILVSESTLTDRYQTIIHITFKQCRRNWFLTFKV